MLSSVGELQLSPGSTRSSLNPGYVWAYHFVCVLYISSYLLVNWGFLSRLTAWPFFFGRQSVMGDRISNTHCVSGDVCICLNWEQWWETACPMLWGTRVSEDMISLNWCPAVLFSYGRLLHDIAAPFTVAVIKDDSGAMVKRSCIFCVLNALNIIPSQEAHKLLLGLPAFAMILHLLHKNWPIRCGIIWLYQIYSEDKCWLPWSA